MGGIEVVYLAGAFGNYVRLGSIVRIGVLEVTPRKIAAAGNTARRGAMMQLISPDCRPLPEVEHVLFAFEPGFQDPFIDRLRFTEMQPQILLASVYK